MPRAKTPILTALIHQTKVTRLPLHVPGHHQGRTFLPEFSQWLGSAAKLDATELPLLDNLHQASGCIRESEQLTAAWYGSKATYYSINGSTAGIMAAIRAVSRGAKDARILFLNPPHISAWRGIVLADAEAVFAPSAYDSELFMFASPAPTVLQSLLMEDNTYSAVYITSPTYQGRVSPIADLVRISHAYDIPVIVDEAHGSHFGIHPAFPQHSVALGADIVVHSAHKTLPSLTQTSFVHVQGERVRASTVEEELNFLQSTSPSYLLLASLDAAQAWLHEESYDRAETWLRTAEEASLEISLEFDPMRLWLPTGNAGESERLNRLCEEQGIILEYADATGALAMFGFDTTPRQLRQFLEVVERWQSTKEPPSLQPEVVAQLFHTSQTRYVYCRPRAIEGLARERVPLANAVGRVLSAPLIPYPPGVPIRYPGEVLDGPAAAILQDWVAREYAVHGVLDDKVEVVKE